MRLKVMIGCGQFDKVSDEGLREGGLVVVMRGFNERSVKFEYFRKEGRTAVQTPGDGRARLKVVIGCGKLDKVSDEASDKGWTVEGLAVGMRGLSGRFD